MILFERVIPEGCKTEVWQGLAEEPLLNKIGEVITAETGRDGLVALALADNNLVASLNARFRGSAKPTNVLSFPAASEDFLVNAADENPAFLGDIALAAETVASEAEASNTPIIHHIAHLIVHGTLHLLGHDHMQDKDAEVMGSLEMRILAHLNIPDPYSRA